MRPMAQPPIQPRSKAASMFMAAPIVFASILMLAIAVLAFLGWKGGTASGERVQMRFSAVKAGFLCVHMRLGTELFSESSRTMCVRMGLFSESLSSVYAFAFGACLRSAPL